jgi:hypothetical protein
VAGVVAAQETYMTAAKHKASWPCGSAAFEFVCSHHGTDFLVIHGYFFGKKNMNLGYDLYAYGYN